MSLLDLVILAVVAAAAIHGLRVGAAVQVATFAGMLAGIAIGAVLVSVIDRYVSGPLTKTVVGLVLLIVPASILAGVGRQLGISLFKVIRRLRFGPVDAVLGALVAVAGTLVVCWLFASALLNSAIPSVSRTIEGSKVLRAVDAVMPPVPNAFASVEKYLSQNGFPVVLVNVLPQPGGPVHEPSKTVVDEAALRVEGSMVKVVAIGCGEEQEGSGFSVGDDLIVTNAHVVAGTVSISATAQNGQRTALRTVYFDPKFDLAVLKEDQPLGLPGLSIAQSSVGRGTEAVLLGYPNDGPLVVRPAAVMERFAAEGRDIYNNALTVRTVYELQAIVRPGNSGGPLVSPSGTVLGVVFSRSASNPDIGYALASPGVLERVEQAEAHPGDPGTSACVG